MKIRTILISGVVCLVFSLGAGRLFAETQATMEDEAIMDAEAAEAAALAAEADAEAAVIADELEHDKAKEAAKSGAKAFMETKK
jgi:hypothetical protein